MKTFEEFDLNNNDKISTFLENHFDFYELKGVFDYKVECDVWFNKSKNYFQIRFYVKQLNAVELDDNKVSDLKKLYYDKIQIYDKAIEYLKKFGKTEKDISSSFGDFRKVPINFYLTNAEILKGIDVIPDEIKSLLTIGKYNL